MTVIPCRVALAGAQLRLLVLASEPDGCIGVDLDSGAFVRATHPPGDEPPRPFDLATGEISAPDFPPDLSRPEAVELSAPPVPDGRLSLRKAERWLRALRHPDNVALLGFSGPTVPYWTLAGDRPSTALVDPPWAPSVRWSPEGFRCRFRWRGVPHDLPMADRRLTPPPEHMSRRYTSRELAHTLGYRPHRLLVVLTPPRQGLCYKLVAALLPRG